MSTLRQALYQKLRAKDVGEGQIPGLPTQKLDFKMFIKYMTKETYMEL